MRVMMENTLNPPQASSYSLKRRRQSSGIAVSPRELGQMRTRHDTGSGSSSFVGSASGIHFARTVRRAFAKHNHIENSSNTAVDDELIPGEDDRLQDQTTHSSLWRADEISFTAREEQPYHFDDLVRWTRSYFDSWHPPFPFLHAPTVLTMLEKLSIHGLTQLNDIEFVTIRAIMSISLADQRQLPTYDGQLIPALLVFQNADEALSAIQPLISRPSTLPGLQAIISVHLFLISMLRLNAASRIGGLVVRIAYHLGLHRCPTRFAQFSAVEAEMRRRIFWSIYALERYLSQSLGLPLDLRDDDIDVCYPGNELHSSEERTESAGITNGSQLLLSKFLSKHGRIKGMILELRNKSILHSSTDPDEVARIDAEISKWWNDVQDLLDPSSFDESTGLAGEAQDLDSTSISIPLVPLKSSHKLLLLIQNYESVILLNRPVLTSGYNTSSFPAALQRCIGAAKAIITNVFRHLSDGLKLQPAQGGRIEHPLVWPGFVWSVWQSGLILFYAASEGHYSIQLLQRDGSRCISILENLAMRGNLWPSSCAAAIRELQSALRSSPGMNISQNPVDISRSTHTQSSPLSYIQSQFSARIINENDNSNTNLQDQANVRHPQTRRPEIIRPESSRTHIHHNSTPYAATESSNLSSSNLSQDLDRHNYSVNPILQNPYQVQLSTTEMTSGQNSELYDIFQLMDTSYVLSGENSAAQPELFGAIGQFPGAHQNI